MTRNVRYQIYGIIFQTFCLVANLTALVFLGALLLDIVVEGGSGLDFHFLGANTSSNPEKAGILTALVGSTYLMLLTAAFAIPMGIGAAIYLEEYAQDTRFVRFIKLNIKNLAGVPSIVYGMLGLALFGRLFGLGNSILAGALTMAIMILPVITISAQEALRAVPSSFRFAGYGIGMTRWQVVQYMVLPVAVPGMLTGVILALSRAIGEAAPLIVVGAAAYITFLPVSPLDSFTVMPIQIYGWTGLPQKEFHELAASGIIVLMVVLLSMNAVAIYLRTFFRNKLRHLG